MARKVTIQDIADALGVSRNTVSKALNNTGILADATRDKILKKAMEMGYKQFSYFASAPALSAPAAQLKEIAMLTCSMPNASHFGSHLLNTFQKKISEMGYRLSIYLVRKEQLDSLTLPANFDPENIAGIICIELFNQAYSNMICQQKIPTLFVDTASNPCGEAMDADLLYMENHDSIYRLVSHLVANGYRHIGFAGDISNCHSFFERYKGYRDALFDLEIPWDKDCCILEKDPYVNTPHLVELLSRMPKLPQVYICANDFVAIDIMKALKAKGLSVPNDILVTGFDNSTESKIVEPHLTTVHIPSDAMGYIAAETLLTRIDHPDTPYRAIHVRTDVKYRASTLD